MWYIDGPAPMVTWLLFSSLKFIHDFFTMSHVSALWRHLWCTQKVNISRLSTSGVKLSGTLEIYGPWLMQVLQNQKSQFSKNFKKMVKKQRMRSRPIWCKQTILVFFAKNIVLSGPKKNSITSSEAIRKIEITTTHSYRRNVPSLLNVPKRPSITVSLYILICLSFNPVTWYRYDTRITNHSSSPEWRHLFNLHECLKTKNWPKENPSLWTVRDSN